MLITFVDISQWQSRDRVIIGTHKSRQEQEPKYDCMLKMILLIKAARFGFWDWFCCFSCWFSFGQLCTAWDRFLQNKRDSLIAHVHTYTHIKIHPRGNTHTHIHTDTNSHIHRYTSAQ